jgi:hypothetical protein
MDVSLFISRRKSHLSYFILKKMGVWWGRVLIIGICFMHINYLYLLLLCINHNCYLYMPSCGSDLVNKLILFYSILLYRDMQKVFVTVFFSQSISFKTLQFSKSYPENSNSSHILITFLSTKAKIRAVFK